MISKKKMDSRLLIAHFMNRNMEILEELDDPEYEEILLDGSGKKIRLVNELMTQICMDQSRNNMRSALRKVILLNRILKKIENTGDE